MNNFNKKQQNAVDYVRINEITLRSEYGDSYIAVHPSGRVIDWDLDEFSLVKRVGLDFPGEFILINTIDKIVNPISLCLDSPEAA